MPFHGQECHQCGAQPADAPVFCVCARPHGGTEGLQGGSQCHTHMSCECSHGKYALPTLLIQHNLHLQVLCRMSCLSYCKYCCLASVVKAYLARSSFLLLFCNGPQRVTSTSKAYMQLCGEGGVWEARHPPHQLEKESIHCNHCVNTHALGSARNGRERFWATVNMLPLICTNAQHHFALSSA